MATADHDGLAIEFDTIGDTADPAMLLVMGFSAQLTAWDLDFCHLLVDRGYCVVRFDNRDCGLSGKSEGSPPNLLSIMMSVASGAPITESVPYSLSEMAKDGLAVLDELSIERAHIVGASMGGMIAQQLAIEHPERVQSLTSIMSTTGDPKVGQGSQEAVGALLGPAPIDRAGAIERGVHIGRVIAGPQFDEQVARARIAEAFDRSYHPQGAPFQLAAIAKTGDRTERLRSLDVPALVIHGLADSLVAPSGGEATADAIPGAKLLTFDDMGHDLPPNRWEEIVGAIAELTTPS